ncbi:hypothetical protein BC833DRAFT_612779 [Globomyces pollinis-pini]|nr:hypothetical protein BC833DRAFT_612779 [Globomyces pollinis-pini]
MSQTTTTLVIVACIVHSFLCLMLPGLKQPMFSAFKNIHDILAFEVYLKLNAVISIFVRSQTILAAAAGSIFSIALGWRLLKNGGTSIEVLDVDHQKLSKLVSLLRTTNQNHVKLLCIVGLLLTITIGLEGIILQETLRDGDPSPYPFSSKIYIPEVKLPTSFTYLFSHDNGLPNAFSGVGFGIGLKVLGDVPLKINAKGEIIGENNQNESAPLVKCSDSATNCIYDFLMPFDYEVECTREQSKGRPTESMARFVNSTSLITTPPTNTWNVTKWNENLTVTHSCKITAGKSIWRESLQGGRERFDFQKYIQVSNNFDGPHFFASGMVGSLLRTLNGGCWGYVGSPAGPLNCEGMIPALTNTIDRDVAPGIATEVEMKYVIDRMARRLTAELMKPKEVECINCEDRPYRYVLPAFKIITIVIDLIILILATASIFIIQSVGPVSNDIVTILKMARNLAEKDLNDKDLGEKVFLIEGVGEQAALKVVTTDKLSFLDGFDDEQTRISLDEN